MILKECVRSTQFRMVASLAIATVPAWSHDGPLGATLVRLTEDDPIKRVLRRSAVHCRKAWMRAKIMVAYSQCSCRKVA